MTTAPLNCLEKIFPGLVLCAGVTLAAWFLEQLEIRFLGKPWLESLVLAIALGTALRSSVKLDGAFTPGIVFSAKFLLEAAVMLLGASVSAAAILENGPALIGGIAAVVFVAIGCSYAIGRVMGLPRKMAVLIACGNSICGNSAIAAVAPVIDASSKDVASSIAFTAVLGVVVVLALPLLAPVLSLSSVQYGIFAGLTVYAVPQVLAATAPVAMASVHIGTLVKLVRVLMLGPVVLILSLAGRGEGRRRPALSHMVPWFIVGFLVLLALRSLNALPTAALGPTQAAASSLTIMSMAGLGLGVDVRSVLRAGKQVTSAVVLSLLVLAAISYGLIMLLGVA
ncbi:MAG: YeiH family protein [Burkholderiaceae bacterium]